MKKIFIKIVSIFLGCLILYGCSMKNEDKVMQEFENQETSVGLPIGNDYLYRSGEHFVKITINSSDQWSIRTEEMKYSKKVTIKNLNNDKDGGKLIQFISKEAINAGYTFSVLDRPEGTNYYLVMDGEDFYLIMDSEVQSRDIKEYVKCNNRKFVKQ